MKTIVAIAILVGLAFFVLRGARKGGGKDETAHALMEKGGRLVDVRTPSEFASGHLEGALNIPVDQIANRLDELAPKDKPVVLYCRSGARSGRAASILRNAGFSEVHNLGTIGRW